MQPIIQHLFQVDSLEEVPRERLEELVATYPSFGMGRYLLSRKLHTEDAGHFSEETQKTNLYFSNPFWLQWLLQNEVAVQKPAYTRLEPLVNPSTEASADLIRETSTPVVEERSGLVAEPSPNLIAEETMIEDEQSWGMPDTADAEVVDHPGHHTPAGPHTDASPIVGQAAVENEFPIIQESAAAWEPAIAGDFFQESLRETDDSRGVEEAHSLEKPVLVDEPGVTAELTAAPLSASDALLQSLEEARGLRQTLVHMNEGEGPVHSGHTDSADEAIAPVEETIAPVEETLTPVEARSEEDLSGGVVGIAESRAEDTQAAGPEHENEQEHLTWEEHVPEEQPATHASEEPQTVNNAPEERQPPHTLEASVEAAVSAAAVTAQATPPEPIVVFEPYHTIDYFASVGIKLTQEDNPGDKLGKQLKSFTEWLKVMRKLPQKNQEIVPDVAAEQQIQAIAAHSITGKDVLTETMAEVLVKQGMRDKAIDVYHKLSLLNPEKSAYFATKIEQLKID